MFRILLEPRRDMAEKLDGAAEAARGAIDLMVERRRIRRAYGKEPRLRPWFRFAFDLIEGLFRSFFSRS